MPPPRAERLEHGPELPARLRVEAGRRLVEEQQLRGADERTADREPLPLAAGELADPGVALRLELHDGEHLVDAYVRPDRTIGTGAASRSTVSFSVSCVSCSWMPSRRRSARSSPRPHCWPSTSTSPPSCGDEPLEDLDRGGLAGAVRAEQAEALAGAHLEVEAVDGDHVAVALHQAGAAERDPRHRGVSPERL